MRSGVRSGRSGGHPGSLWGPSGAHGLPENLECLSASRPDAAPRPEISKVEWRRMCKAKWLERKVAVTGHYEHNIRQMPFKRTAQSGKALVNALRVEIASRREVQQRVFDSVLCQPPPFWAAFPLSICVRPSSMLCDASSCDRPRPVSLLMCSKRGRSRADPGSTHGRYYADSIRGRSAVDPGSDSGSSLLDLGPDSFELGPILVDSGPAPPMLVA